MDDFIVIHDVVHRSVKLCFPGQNNAQFTNI